MQYQIMKNKIRKKDSNDDFDRRVNVFVVFLGLAIYGIYKPHDRSVNFKDLLTFKNSPKL